jgi:thioredoxin-related protein
MKKNRTIIYPMIFLCVFFFVSFLTAPKGNYSTDKTFSEVLDMVKSEDEFVIYFARDDCPECQKVDKLLKKNNGKLKKDISGLKREQIQATDFEGILRRMELIKYPLFGLSTQKL